MNVEIDGSPRESSMAIMPSSQRRPAGAAVAGVLGAGDAELGHARG